MKTCQGCGARIPNWVVFESKRRNFQRRKYCLDCSPFGSGNHKKKGQGQTSKPQFPDNSKYVRWQKKARRERKAELIRLLGGGCKVCGYNRCQAALDFHHRDPKTKKFSLANQGLLRSWDQVLVEAEKCDLLCKNCHMETHEND